MYNGQQTMAGQQNAAQQEEQGWVNQAAQGGGYGNPFLMNLAISSPDFYKGLQSNMAANGTAPSGNNIMTESETSPGAGYTLASKTPFMGGSNFYNWKKS